MTTSTATKPEDKPAVEKRRTPPQPNRFFVSFGTKYAKVHDQIVKDAEADDRDPGEFLVRWLQQHYNSGAGKESA